MTLETMLFKDDEQIKCMYYEIEEKCIEIITKYCSKSEENNRIFQEFSSKYKTFRPYFDFVICKLGYKLLNPQLEKDKILVGRKNHMFVYKKSEEAYETNFRYGMSDDKTLNLYPMKLDSSTFHDCLIDGNNNHILPSDMVGHVQILQQILNNLLICHKAICEDFLEYSSDIGFFVQRYLPIIRFQADKQGKMVITRCVYRKSNITQKQNDFMNELLDNRLTYPSFLLNVDEKDKYNKTKDYSAQMSFDEYKSYLR